MLVSHASTFPRALFPAARAYERRVTLALVCSGALHVSAAALATAWLTLLPPKHPDPSSDQPALIAVLRDAPPAPMVEVLPPAIAPESMTLPDPPRLLAVPAIGGPAPAAVAPPPARALPAPERGPITSSDPNGTVTMGFIGTPATLGIGTASRLAERYPARVDKLPRMLGSMGVRYPPAARQARASARIAAVLEVDERGRITRASLVPAHPWFGPMVEDALKDVRFAPAELGMDAVPYWVIVEFVFAIAPASPQPSLASSVNSPKAASEHSAGAIVPAKPD